MTAKGKSPKIPSIIYLHCFKSISSVKPSNKLKKPCFVYAGKDGVSRGSVRMPKGVNGVEALNHCRDLLDVYGGHPQAAGFTIKNGNLAKFEQCLIDYFEKL